MPTFTRRKFFAYGAGFGAMVLSGDGLSGTSSPALNVGIAGLGRQGLNHLRALSRIPGARIAAICDPHPRALQAGAQIVSSGAAFLDNFRRLLDRSEIDLVVISAPPPERLWMIEAAARAGKHVIVEQPGLLSLPDASRLHNLAAIVPVSVEHFPSDPGWDGEALLPWLYLDQPQRVEIQVLRPDFLPDAALDEFKIAAQLLRSGLPQRSVALTAAGFPGLNLSAEIETGTMRVALHQSRRVLPAGIERRILITVENTRESRDVSIDWMCYEGDRDPALAAWSRAIAGIANGNRERWIAATERTAVASAMVHMVTAARARGEFVWSPAWHDS